MKRFFILYTNAQQTVSNVEEAMNKQVDKITQPVVTS